MQGKILGYSLLFWYNLAFGACWYAPELQLPVAASCHTEQLSFQLGILPFRSWSMIIIGRSCRHLRVWLNGVIIAVAVPADHAPSAQLTEVISAVRRPDGLWGILCLNEQGEQSAHPGTGRRKSLYLTAAWTAGSVSTDVLKLSY